MDNINISDSLHIELLGIADPYLVPGLKMLVQNHLLAKLTKQNACELLVKADKFGA